MVEINIPDKLNVSLNRHSLLRLLDRNHGDESLSESVFSRVLNDCEDFSFNLRDVNKRRDGSTEGIINSYSKPEKLFEYFTDEVLNELNSNFPEVDCYWKNDHRSIFSLYDREIDGTFPLVPEEEEGCFKTKTYLPKAPHGYYIKEVGVEWFYTEGENYDR